MEPCKTKKLGVGRSFSRRWPLQHSAHYCYHLSWRIDLSWIERGGRMGFLQWRLLLKFHEECPSGCRCRRRGLDLEVGDFWDTCQPILRVIIIEVPPPAPRPPPPPEPILFPCTENHWDTPQELLKVMAVEAHPYFPPLSVQDKSLRHERW